MKSLANIPIDDTNLIFLLKYHINKYTKKGLHMYMYMYVCVYIIIIILIDF